MRYAATLLLLVLLGATLALAQTLPTFKHILIVIQENRTPDNLFGAAPRQAQCGVEDPFETGVDIDNGGPNKEVNPPVSCLTPTSLNICWDPQHSNKNWNDTADIQPNGTLKMDGACVEKVGGHTCTPLQCPQYTFVQKSDVQQYFDIATSYGFANYMFETNEGPSFPAHQFLLSGTSAPVKPGVNNYLDFVAENADFHDSGCPYPGSMPEWVDPTGTQNNSGPDCYDHLTLVSQLDPKHVTWRYYTPTPDVIWTAPSAISSLCGNIVNNVCTGPDFANVIWPGKSGPPTPAIPVIYDIQNCNLQNVSWVIPDERWSDHPSFTSGPVTGPSYVANIVDAIGNATTCDGGAGYWSDTAIFITWDDWGGFYDHVPPPVVWRKGGPVSDCPDPTLQWGCGYTYGFRVPLLVVSAYTPAGYVSGAISGPPTYPPPKEFTHDFGSILAFIENNFGLGQISPPPYTNEYADINAIDRTNGNIPLSDFFSISPSTPRSFVSILPATGYDYAGYFQNYYINNNTTPMGPDGGDTD